MSTISTKQYLYGTDVVSGGTIVTGGTLMVGYSNDTTIVGGGTAVNTVVNGDDAGCVFISGSGLANAPITLNTLEMSSGLARISGAANLTEVTLNLGATMSAQNTANGKIQIDGVMVNGGKLILNPVSSGADFAGGTIADVTLNGGSISCYGGVVSGATVIDGKWKGWHTQFYDIVISGGTLSSIADTGLVQNATIYGGYLQLSSGKTSNVTVSGGTLKAFGSAHTTIDTTVYGGTVDFNGFSKKTTEGWYAYPNIYSNTVVSGGDVKFSGGLVKDLSVYGGNVIFLTKPLEEGMNSGGLILEGTVNVGGGAISISNDASAAWVNDSNATWNFDLTGRDGSEAAAISNFSFTNASKFAISVSSQQESGTYALAGNAANLNGKTFSVTSDGVEIASVTVGGPTVSTASGDYTLALTGEALAVTIEAKTVGPVMLFKNGEMVANGTSFSDVLVGGVEYDGMVVLSGGNVNGVSGAVSSEKAIVISGGSVTNMSMVASGGVGCIEIIGGEVSGAVIETDGMGLLASAPIMSDFEFHGSGRFYGGIHDADFFADMSGNIGSAAAYEGAYFDGTVNVYSNALIDVVQADSKANPEGQFVGVTNIYNGGTIRFDNDGNDSAKIGADAVVNIYDGGVLSQGDNNAAELVIAGTVNLSGGCINNDLTTSGGNINLSGGSVNFDLAGIATATDSTAFVKNFDSIVGKETFVCTVNVDSTAYGNYYLFGMASSYDRGVVFSIDGVVKDSNFQIGSSVEKSDANRKYSLVKDADSNVVLSISYLNCEGETGTLEEVGGVASGVWGATTTYNTDMVNVGNSNADISNSLLIDNVGATGAMATWVVGGAGEGEDTAAVEIELYRGEIGAIMGGAVNGSENVESVDITIGGGDAAATTKVVYGAGFGNVTGATTITTEANAVVTGQLYGGAMAKGGVVMTLGEINLNLNGGELKSDVIGGARMQTDSSHSTVKVGAIDINLNGASLTGGADACVYGAGWVFGKEITAARTDGEADSTAASVTIDVNSDVAAGTANGRGIFGGALAAKYSIAEVSGSVEINVTGCEVAGNVYGGGWAQSAAKSNVTGNVTINVTDATVGNIYGGGAHGASAEVSGTTSVGADVAITIDNSTVGLVCAVGQAEDDVIEGNATITVTGASVIDNLSGVGYLDAGKDTSATLVLEDFTGSVNSNVRCFDMVTVKGDTTATFANVDECFGWEIFLNDRTSTDAVLTWKDGSFAAEVEDYAAFDLYLNSEAATAWTVADLSGDDAKDGAFDNVTFNLYDGNAVAIKTGYVLGSEIADTSTAWDGWKLDYQDGKLAFAQLA